MKLWIKPVLLATSLGLVALSCGEVAESDDKAKKETGTGSEGSTATETADDPKADLAARGFALHPGELKYEEVGNPEKTSRFVVTVLNANDEPIVGAEVRMQRLDGDLKSKKRKIVDKVVKKNPRSNVFTVMIKAGQDYEISVSAAGYANGSKTLSFDSAKAVDVAFPFSIDQGETKPLSTPPMDPTKPKATNADPGPVAEEAEIQGLKFCDVRGDKDDFEQIIGLIEKNYPKNHEELTAKYLANGYSLRGCSGVPYPQISLYFYNKEKGEKAAYVIENASNLKDYWYGIGDMPAPVPDEQKPEPEEDKPLPDVKPDGFARPGAKVGDEDTMKAVRECNGAGYFYDRMSVKCDETVKLAAVDCLIDSLREGVSKFGDEAMYVDFKARVADLDGMQLDQCVYCGPKDERPACATASMPANGGTKLFFAAEDAGKVVVKHIMVPLHFDGNDKKE